MMKKLLSIVFIAFTLVLLSSCTDKKYSDETVNVLFFTANSGSTQVESYLDLDPDTLIEKPEDPIRPGYSFLGWYTEKEYTTEWEFTTEKVGEKSFILYAKWQAIIHNIIYDVNGGEMPTSSYVTTFITGESKVLPLPKRTGFTFKAWYRYDWEDEKSTIPGDAGYQTTPPKQYEDLYLYAHWVPVSINITFRTNYPVSGQGPSNPTSQVAFYGDVIDFIQFDDTATHTFLGWNTRDTGEGDWYVNGENILRTQRLTLYGIWQEK